MKSTPWNGEISWCPVDWGPTLQQQQLAGLAAAAAVVPEAVEIHQLLCVA